MRACHIRDGVAVSRFLAWLDAEVAAKAYAMKPRLPIKLESFRLQDERYRDQVSTPISAAGPSMPPCAITITTMAHQR